MKNQNKKVEIVLLNHLVQQQIIILYMINIIVKFHYIKISQEIQKIILKKVILQHLNLIQN